jgi:hypothetical protein
MQTGNARPAIVFREECQLWVISGHWPGPLRSDGEEARSPTDLFILETVQFVREPAMEGTANAVRR